MPNTPDQKLLDIAERAMGRAKAFGADAVDTVIVESISHAVSCRLGELEEVERSEARDLGLRVFIGNAHAIVSSTDFSDAAMDELAERAVAMAKIAPGDEFSGLAEPGQLATEFPDLDMFDEAAPASDELKALALAAEDAGRAVIGITNSLGASASAGVGGMVLAASNGFSAGYRSSGFSLSCALVAGTGTGMERDYDYSNVVFFTDLDDPEAVGRKAGERALARLKPQKLASQSLPVIYDPRISGGLVGHFAGAISGAAVARGTSFLKNRMGEQVFAEGISIIDDPHMKRGLRSRPFDGEGVANARMALAQGGVLKSWLLDCRSARQLGLKSNGHAGRGVGGPPSPSATNLYMGNGKASPKDLIGDIARGLYVTDLIGMGVNGTTGDYSRGASGFLIEDGEIVRPVSEITIAGNLKDMYLNMTAANDLEFRHGTNAPTVRIDGMTIAGK